MDLTQWPPHPARRQCDRDPGERSETSAGTEATRPAARTQQVLVVEDEPSLRTMLAEALRFAGYEVTTANNGRHALALLDEVTPDVIVLDLMMPVMDGFAFRARQLLTTRLASIPVIVLSATHDLDSVARTLRPFAWMSKPFDLDAVLASVAAACGAAV
jgi:two-component system, chemotaxis family, chemotaxis protein CheY